MEFMEDIRQMLCNLIDDNGNRLFDNDTVNTTMENLNTHGYGEINPLIQFVLGDYPMNPHENRNDRWENIGIDAYVGEQIYLFLLNN